MSEELRLPEVLHLLVGPHEHGVVRFGRRLGELMGSRVRQLVHPESAADGHQEELAAVLRSGPQAVHLQYTDALYASHTTAAAAAFVQLRRRIAVPVGVTLHDLPDPDDEPARYRRRARSYARVARAVDVVAVSSYHELALLEHLLAATGERYPTPADRVQVIPLPLEFAQLTDSAQRPEPVPEVAVFGFLYPGKGHRDVLEAMSGLPPQVSFTALGRIAHGHDQLGAALAATARRARRGLQITGFIPDQDVPHQLKRVAVPVVPARMISASGSINSWIAAGRRPLVADGSYAREFDRRYPGAIQLYRPEQLPELIRAILADPDRSWLQTPVPAELAGPAIARSYAELLLGTTVSSR